MNKVHIELYKKEIIDAYQVLFNGTLNNSTRPIQQLDISLLKSRYRDEALKNHPDRARLLGKSPGELSARFTEINLAYEKLYTYIKENKKIFHQNSSLRRNYSSSERNQSNRYRYRFAGKCPDFELPIGQFLFYNGYITWKTLLDAIFWQRMQRPLFGQIAKEWGILTDDDITIIRKSKKHRERFGEFALNHGYISPFQHLAIIGKQRRLQPLIGEYFIQRGIISDHVMKVMIEKQRIHNLRVNFQKKR